MRLTVILRMIMCIGLAALFGCSTEYTPTEEALQLYSEAKAAYEKGSLEEAVARLKTLCGQESNFHEAAFLLGKAYFFSGALEDAFRTFNGVWNTFPNYTDAGIWLSRTELQLHKTEAAKSRLLHLLRYNSENPHIFNLLALAHKQSGNMDTALYFFHQASAFEQALFKNKLQLAQLYTELGFTDRAVNTLQSTSSLESAANSLLNSLLEANDE